MSSKTVNIKIDKKIPLAPIRRGMPRKYPFDEMKIGDSFLFPKETRQITAQAAVYRASRIFNAKYSLRKTEDGIRCWRIK